MVEIVMVVSSLLMGDEAFFLLGDGCFFGNPLDLVAMLATPMMMARRADDCHVSHFEKIMVVACCCSKISSGIGNLYGSH
jgi:hypothetical protein